MKMVHLSICVWFFYTIFRHWEQTSKLRLPFLNMCTVFNIFFYALGANQ